MLKDLVNVSVGGTGGIRLRSVRYVFNEVHEVRRISFAVVLDSVTNLNAVQSIRATRAYREGRPPPAIGRAKEAMGASIPEDQSMYFTSLHVFQKPGQLQIWSTCRDFLLVQTGRAPADMFREASGRPSQSMPQVDKSSLIKGGLRFAPSCCQNRYGPLRRSVWS